MARIAHTYPSNQWCAEDFFRQVDRDEQAEVRVAAVYGRSVDLPAIRNQVLGAILAYAIPAGNA